MAHLPVVQPTTEPADLGHEKVGRAPIIRTPVASQQREDASDQVLYVGGKGRKRADCVAHLARGNSESHREGE